MADNSARKSVREAKESLSPRPIPRDVVTSGFVDPDPQSGFQRYLGVERQLRPLALTQARAETPSERQFIGVHQVGETIAYEQILETRALAGIWSKPSPTPADLSDALRTLDALIGFQGAQNLSFLALDRVSEADMNQTAARLRAMGFSGSQAVQFHELFALWGDRDENRRTLFANTPDGPVVQNYLIEQLESPPMEERFLAFVARRHPDLAESLAHPKSRVPALVAAGSADPMVAEMTAKIAEFDHKVYEWRAHHVVTVASRFGAPMENLVRGVKLLMPALTEAASAHDPNVPKVPAPLAVETLRAQIEARREAGNAKRRSLGLPDETYKPLNAFPRRPVTPDRRRPAV